jgi:hypothetical protein
MKKLVLLSAVVAAICVPAASASPAYTIPELRVHPQVVAFGSAEIGSCSGATYSACLLRRVTIENIGSETIWLAGWGTDIGPQEFPSFSLGNNVSVGSCGRLPAIDGYGALAPGSSCFIEVVFVPREEGPVWGTLFVLEKSRGYSAPIALIPLFGVGM